MKLFSLLFLFLTITGKEKAQDISQIAEKVYLHTDRNQYIAGEDIWFKAYVIDPSTNELSVNTNNLHVELIAPDSKILLSRMVRIEEGTGNGDFSLSDSIPSGTYRIRAYTNHMRNYDDKFFFLKEINVINPYENENETERPDKKITNKIDISFFPEGGSLVDNVTSTVAFKAVNALGKGCDVTVELYKYTGELITVFNSRHLGMGFFNLKPVPGEKYYTIVRGEDGTETRADLPASFPSGLAIRTFLPPDKNLILTVNTNENTLPSVLGHEFSVNLSSRGLVNQKVNIRIDSLVNNYLIPLDTMPEGIIQLTVSEFEGLPLAERLFFFQKHDSCRIKITTNKTEYIPREKVAVKLSLSCDTTLSGNGVFSLSAAGENNNVNSTLYPTTIASWFLLESDVRGRVEGPSYYFNPDNKNRLQDLDVLLMTQGWRDFRWKYDTLSSFRHEIGYRISGNVSRVVGNKPIVGAKINLGLFSEKTSWFLSTETGRDGLYRFDELDIYGRTEAFISSVGKLEKMAGRISVDTIIYKPPEAEVLEQDSAEQGLEEKQIPQYRVEARYRLDLKKKYKLSDTISIGEVSITATKIETPREVKVRESRRIYTVPDKELIVQPAQENFSGDVFSYLFGRIPGVQVVRGIDKTNPFYPNDVQIFIRGQYSTKKIEGGSDIKIGALILLDGYELEDAGIGFVLNTPMNSIDRIDVLNPTPLYGMRGANGVINIITKHQLGRSPAYMSSNSQYLNLKGFDVPRFFYSPDYENQSQNVSGPDLRSTLFWKPDINLERGTEMSLEFYNNDEKGVIQITVEGITKEGIPIAGKVCFWLLGTRGGEPKAQGAHLSTVASAEVESTEHRAQCTPCATDTH